MRACRLGSVALALTLTACEAIISLPDTAGIEVHPARRNQVLGAGEAVSVSFDREVSRLSVEDIFLVEEAAGRLAGSYRWEGRRVLFVPDEPYTPGRRYVVVFSGSFEDSRGVSYSVHHSAPFFFESAGETPPAVLSVTPPGGSTIGLADSLLITFSTAVNPATLLRGISLSPSVDIEREVDPTDPSGRSVTIRPRESWKSFTVYNLTVSPELEDLSGRPLIREYQASFLAQEDATAPELLAAEAAANDPGGSPPFSGPGSDLTAIDYELLPQDVFRFAFSEAMDREATEGALSLSPAVAGSTFWPREELFVYVPDQPLATGRSYTLILDSTATDRAGMPLANPLSLELKATLEPLTVVVELVEDGIVLSGSREDAATIIRPGLSPDFGYNVALTFSAPFEASADKLALRQSIRFRPLLSNGFTPPFLVGYSWPTNREIRLTYHNVSPFTAAEQNYLLFSLPGGAAGIAASAGNRLEKDFRVLLLPEAD